MRDDKTIEMPALTRALGSSSNFKHASTHVTNWSASEFKNAAFTHALQHSHIHRCPICIHRGRRRGDGWRRISTSCLALLHGRGKGEAEQEEWREEARRMAGGGRQNGARMGMEARLCIVEHGIHETKQSSQCGCHHVSKDLVTALTRFVPTKPFMSLSSSIHANILFLLMCHLI
jgi:hypothetical protein